MARRQRWLEVAYQYDNLGFMPIPLQRGKSVKHPLLVTQAPSCGFLTDEMTALYQAGWGESPFTWERFHEMFALAGGIGIAVGPCSGGLAVLDFDDVEAHRIWLASHRRLVRALPQVTTFRGVHYYFRPASRPACGYFEFRVDGYSEIAGELRLANGYVVASPSRHPDGGKYRWAGKCLPAQLPVVAIDELGIQRAADSAASLINPDRHEPPVYTLTGSLTHSGGVGECLSDSEFWSKAFGLMRSHLPREVRSRHSCLLPLVRSLKRLSVLHGCPVERFEPLIRAWCQELETLRNTGETQWRSLADEGGMWGSAFSSPLLTEIAGQEQLLVQTRTRLVGVNPKDGAELWTRDIEAFRGMNILTPTVYDDSVITSSYGGKTILHRLNSVNGTITVDSAWEDGSQGYMSSPLIIEDHAFLHLRNRRFACFDLRSGKQTWRTTPFAEYWSLVANGDRILALDCEGQLRLIRANPERYEELDSVKVADAPTWAHLAVCGDEVVIRELNGLAYYRWRNE